MPSSAPPKAPEPGLLCKVDSAGRLVWTSAPMIADDAGSVEFHPAVVRPNLDDLNAFLALDQAAKVRAMGGLREYSAWVFGADLREPPKVQAVTAQLQNLFTTMALVVSVIALSITTPTARGLAGVADVAVFLLMAIVLAVALWAGLRIGRLASVDTRTYAANLRLLGEVATAWLGTIADATHPNDTAPTPGR